MRSKCFSFASSAVVISLVTSLAFPQLLQAAVPNANDDVRSPVIINYGDGKAINTSTDHGIAPRIGLRPSQLVTVILQLPTSRSGEFVSARPLDGGRITAPAGGIFVQVDGKVRFDFQAGHGPGLYKIWVELGSDEYKIQFYVLDETHPENNPRVPVAE